MNTDILMIGNGFDVAHGLPTKYNDFLEVCVIATNPGTKDPSNYTGKSTLFKSFIQGLSDSEKYKQFRSLVMNNIWIYHFSHQKAYISDKWIDFEAEIYKVVSWVAKDMQNDEFSDPHNTASLFSIVEYLGRHEKYSKGFTYRKLFELLLSHHHRLIKAMDIYMDCFVNNIAVAKLRVFENRAFNRVISFNYTATYTERYFPIVDCCYIHGKANSSQNGADICNLVLGFDDHYLSSSEVISELIPFEKYYQRIVNRNDITYFQWIDDIKKNDNETHLYIFGHSLSPADGDIIRSFVLLPQIRTHIVCRDELDRADKVKNLALVLSPTKLIELTGGFNPSIVFEWSK